MYDITKRGELTITEYLYRCLKEDILRCRISGGEKLPSKRALADMCGVSVTSVQGAYELLLCEGYIYSLPKKGYYAEHIDTNEVTHIPYKCECRVTESADIGMIDESHVAFPFSTWTRLMRNVISERHEGLMERMPLGGALELRSSIARHLYSTAGLDISPENIIIGAGSELLISLAVMLIGRAKIYAFPEPCYKKIPRLFEANGVPARYISAQGDGISIPELESTGASVLHISPSNHYPLGGVMSVSNRADVIKWLRSSDSRFIIEDDFDSELRLTGARLPTLFGSDPTGRVIYINTFTKTVSPSLRIGYMVLSERLLDILKKELSFLSCTVPALEQYTLAKFISGGYYERHINRLRADYRAKKQLLIKALSIIGKPDVISIIPSKTGTSVIIKLNSQDLCPPDFLTPISEFYITKSGIHKDIYILNLSRVTEKNMALLESRLKDI